ncbi:hypothetical protein COLO4_29332 [Corchorus olitorius]|uniref:Uncharacterized protein n=1 Tax=Corchorus olitorius TaxID=93759 RepID=A0A1R3HF66_9ROSI|nr:hypothetical protein COLO4_29332 [Corchorus olitorius]
MEDLDQSRHQDTDPDQSKPSPATVKTKSMAMNSQTFDCEVENHARLFARSRRRTMQEDKRSRKSRHGKRQIAWRWGRFFYNV